MKALLFTAFAAAGAAAAVAPRAAAAEPLAEVARAQIEATLPADLGIVEVHLTPRLAALDVDPAVVTAEWTRPPRAGTASVKLAWGKPSRFVPVTLAAVAAVPVAVRDLAPGEPITAADVSIEERPLAAGATFAAQPVGQTATTAIAAGSIIGAGAVTRPAPIPRGTAVRVEVRQGAVVASARGTLERPARVGEPAQVRLSADRTPITGTLADAGLVVVEGGAP